MQQKTLFGYLPATNCGRCRKRLSNPKSVQRGFGPVCWSKINPEEKEDAMTRTDDISDYNILTPLDEGVILKRDDVGLHTNVPHLVVHHSPTGYEWGYAGSGPADLALNIVENALRKMGYDGPKTDDTFDGSTIFKMSWLLHQEFKQVYIAVAPQEGGVLSWSEVVDWIDRAMVGTDVEAYI